MSSACPSSSIPGLPSSLNADPDQLEQMFINLLANAVDASLASDAQPVRVELENGRRLRACHH